MNLLQKEAETKIFMIIIEQKVRIFEDQKFSLRNQKTSDKQLMWITKEKGQKLCLMVKYFLSLNLDLKNVLSIKEAIHYCMIRHHALKLLKHRDCLKKVVLISCFKLMHSQSPREATSCDQSAQGNAV